MKNFLLSSLGFLVGCLLGGVLLLVVVLLASCHADLDEDPRQQEPEIVVYEQVWVIPNK